MEQQKKLLLKIFTITEGEENAKLATDNFVNLMFEDIVYNLIQSLPHMRRSSVSQKWDDNRGNPAALTSLLHHNFSALEIEQESKKTAQQAIDVYLQSVIDQLDESQKEKIRALSEQPTQIS